jgi:hypothetical protein
LLLLTCQVTADDSTAPAPAGDGNAVLQRLLDRGKLELSTRPTSAAERFHFVCKVQSGPTTRSFYVVRDGDRVALVAWPGDAEGGAPPSLYSTNGLTVAVDPDEPGGLILLEGGQPEVTVTADATGLVMEFGASSNQAAPAPVLLDVAPILKRALEKSRRSNYDPRRGVAQVDTGRSVVTVLVPTDPAKQTVLGFEELVLGGQGLGVGIKIPRSAEPTRDYLSVTAADVRKLGVPVRTPGKEFDVKRLWLSPVDLRRDARLAAAAEKLQSLFKPKAAPPILENGARPSAR